MRLTWFALLSLLFALGALPTDAQPDNAGVGVGDCPLPDFGTGDAVLHSRIAENKRDGNNEYGRSAFNFELGDRSDAPPERTRNEFELLYGNLSIRGDRDWFQVVTVANRSRIRDLGEMEWQEVIEVPLLEPRSQPGGAIRFASPGESLENASGGVASKAQQGHVYAVRTTDTDSNHLVLFRVDRLEPGERCDLSWRIVARYPLEPVRRRPPSR